MQDLLEALRPGLERAATFEEAAAAVAQIEAAEAEADAAGEESDASESDAGSNTDGGAYTAVTSNNRCFKRKTCMSIFLSMLDTRYVKLHDMKLCTVMCSAMQ